MNSTQSGKATLVDLLDRVLDKGVMLDADVIVHVAGIPLLGLKLRAALAGMETMLKYGMWEDWEEAQRAMAAKEHPTERKALQPSEVSRPDQPAAEVVTPV